MNRLLTKSQTVVLCIALLFSTTLTAQVYDPVTLQPVGVYQDTRQAQQLAYARSTTQIDTADWYSSGNKLSCSLSQDIKRLGTATFTERAGSGTDFILHTQRNPLAAGQAMLVAEAPVWAPQLVSRTLGPVQVFRGTKAVQVDNHLANAMLASLQRGMVPEFQGAAWFDTQQTIDVSISPKHFLKAYDQFLRCSEQLLSKNFEQISRSRVHFDTDKHAVNAVARAQLDQIVEYSKADKSVKRFYIDGHTDNVHDRNYNIELSKRRARAVAAYLTRSGISQKRITTRYHGERYPVVANTNDANRLKNRRVTVRLER
ncbi:MAG: OmpA family protein [Pseudomonadota bacterium]